MKTQNKLIYKDNLTKEEFKKICDDIIANCYKDKKPYLHWLTYQSIEVQIEFFKSLGINYPPKQIKKYKGYNFNKHYIIQLNKAIKRWNHLQGLK